MDPTYCEAASASPAFEHIARFELASIDNESGAGTYSDFTGFVTPLVRGTSVPVTVTLGSAAPTDTGGLWIDWNEDEDFDDAGEAVPTDWFGVGPYTATIDVSLDIEEGAKREGLEETGFDFGARFVWYVMGDPLKGFYLKAHFNYENFGATLFREDLAGNTYGVPGPDCDDDSAPGTCTS